MVIIGQWAEPFTQSTTFLRTIIFGSSNGLAALATIPSRGSCCRHRVRRVCSQCSTSVPRGGYAELVPCQPCSHCSQCSLFLNNMDRIGHCVNGISAGNPEHWELEESIAPRLGTHWEQDWEHWEHFHLRQPSDTAIRAGCRDAPGTSASPAPAGNARHESCPSASTAPGAC